MSIHVPQWYMDEWDEIMGNAPDPRQYVPDVLDKAQSPTRVAPILQGPEPVPVRPRWWYTTDGPTLARITFLPDYEPRDGDMVIVGMRAAWDGGEMDLVCDRLTGEYFRKVREMHSTTEYGKVFAPAPPPVGLWSGEQPQ